MNERKKGNAYILLIGNAVAIWGVVWSKKNSRHVPCGNIGVDLGATHPEYFDSCKLTAA